MEGGINNNLTEIHSDTRHDDNKPARGTMNNDLRKRSVNTYTVIITLQKEVHSRHLSIVSLKLVPN